jgi:short subunit dehydrogenase-like uncharacterized protein
MYSALIGAMRLVMEWVPLFLFCLFMRLVGTRPVVQGNGIDGAVPARTRETIETVDARAHGDLSLAKLAHCAPYSSVSVSAARGA